MKEKKNCCRHLNSENHLTRNTLKDKNNTSHRKWENQTAYL